MSRQTAAEKTFDAARNGKSQPLPAMQKSLLTGLPDPYQHFRKQPDLFCVRQIPEQKRSRCRLRCFWNSNRGCVYESQYPAGSCGPSAEDEAGRLRGGRPVRRLFISGVFLCKEALIWFCEVLAGEGVNVCFVNMNCPTPQISMALRQKLRPVQPLCGENPALFPP